MSRRHVAEKRMVLPDTRYNSVLLAKFINHIMSGGKKALAEKIVYGALSAIEKKHKIDPLGVFNDALHNVKPELEVNSVRVGGANYQVPMSVDMRRGEALACRWVIVASEKRTEKSMMLKLAEELFDAANSRGGAYKKREDTHKMAESNKAFAHFAVRKNQR